jgi:hypothetical protein
MMESRNRNECCICLESMTSPNPDTIIPITTLKCGHQLHTLCLMQLADKQSTTTIQCPLCRAEIFTFVNRPSLPTLQQRTIAQSSSNALTLPRHQLIILNDEFMIVETDTEEENRRHSAAVLGTACAGLLFFLLLAYGAYMHTG